MHKYEIAKEAYKQIVKAIVDIEEKYQILCELPHSLEVYGEHFHKSQLHHFSVRRDNEGKIIIE